MEHDLKKPENVYYNQVTSKVMNAYFKEGKLRMSEAIGSVQTVYFPIEESDSSILFLSYIETDTMRMFFTPERKMEKIWASKSEGTLYPLNQIPQGKDYLPNFGWYDYIRPVDKDDIYYIPGRHDKQTVSSTDKAPYSLTRRMRQVRIEKPVPENIQ